MMSILHKMISLDEIKNINDHWLVKVCPAGFVPVMVEKHQFYRRNSKPQTDWRFIYVPEYYNYKDLEWVTGDFWNKEDPITKYKKSSATYEHRWRATLSSKYFHINEDRDGLSWGNFLNDEQDKIAKEYRERLTDEKVEWGFPLNDVCPTAWKLWTTPIHQLHDEELQYVSYYERRDEFDQSEVA